MKQEPLTHSMAMDSEQADELLSDFNERYSRIESALEELRVIPSAQVLQKIFREVHTIKGNAAIYQLKSLVEPVHALEDVISAIQEGSLCAEKSICDIIASSLDRLRDLHYQLLGDAQFSGFDGAQIAELLRQLARAKSADDIRAASKAAITSLTHSFGEEHESPLVSGTIENLSPDTNSSISFFADIAEQIDGLSPYWQDRSKLQNYWAQRINDAADRPVSPEQLSAAVFLHDLGMPFLPQELLETPGKLTDQQQAELQNHAQWGFDLVRRMKGFEEAATIVYQHHERIDGKGYPRGLTGNAMHEGAKLIAILDAFFAMIHKRADRQHRRTVLRAIAEINACSGTQFCPKWVEFFNIIMRDEVKYGMLKGKD